MRPFLPPPVCTSWASGFARGGRRRLGFTTHTTLTGRSAVFREKRCQAAPRSLVIFCPTSFLPNAPESRFTVVLSTTSRLLFIAPVSRFIVIPPSRFLSMSIAPVCRSLLIFYFVTAVPGDGCPSLALRGWLGGAALLINLFAAA